MLTCIYTRYSIQQAEKFVHNPHVLVESRRSDGGISARSLDLHTDPIRDWYYAELWGNHWPPMDLVRELAGVNQQ